MLYIGKLQPDAGFPAPLDVQGQLFYLVQDGDRHYLCSSVCPHQGGRVALAGDRFECPLHHWTFDKSTGACLNVQGRSLERFAVRLKGDNIYADIPPALVRKLATRTVNTANQGDNDLSIRLLGHACLEIRRPGFTLLTDPWLVGRAFLGSWIRFPSSDIDPSSLKPDALLLTHEHSDHFHEPTLRLLDRSIPVYVPDFPNQRMLLKLRRLGFPDVHPLRFGSACRIAADWSITFYEPESIWNDAVAMIDSAGFRLLNVNDAGLNRRIAPMVAPVDLLATQFSTGASGYPWTWSHLTDAQKAHVSARSCQGKLALLRDAVQLYDARMLLPFASHFSLWHPSHMEYLRQMTLNTVDLVNETFAGSGVPVIDLLPGDTFNAGTGAIQRGRVREYGFPTTEHRIARALQEQAAGHRNDETGSLITRDQLTAYLLRLNNAPEIIHCDNLSGVFSVCGPEYDIDLFSVPFRIENASLSITEKEESPNLTVRLPLPIVSEVVRNDLSWDEAFIGYWCRFDRNPDTYHAGFWRLMQSPATHRATAVRVSSGGDFGRESTIAQLLEAWGDDADRILRRYGLYCLGCEHSTQETVANAAAQHGLAQRHVDVMIQELNRL